MNDRRSHQNGGGADASRRRFRGGDSSRSSSHQMHPPPPEVGSIFEGTIEQIQPYGAFCAFGPLVGRDPQRQRRAFQGLVHISQLSDARVEKVEDYVNTNDLVWVKVLEVEQKSPNSNFDHHVRYRIKLSMKDVSQDGRGQDLGKEREAKEQITKQLQTNLNSMIGMGVALDPMERIVLKNSGRFSGGDNSNGLSSSSKTTFRGGYTLVGDDEGEPEPDSSTAVAETTSNSFRVAPMGRGRGATLPAWMTSTEGPIGAFPGGGIASENKNGVEDKYQDDSDESDRSRKRDRKRKKKKGRYKHKRRKRSREYSDDESSGTSSHYEDEERRRRRRHKSLRKKHKRKDHRRSSSKRKDKKKRKHSHRGEHEKDEEDSRRSRSRKRCQSDESSRDEGSMSDSSSSNQSR